MNQNLNIVRSKHWTAIKNYIFITAKNMNKIVIKDDSLYIYFLKTNK